MRLFVLLTMALLLMGDWYVLAAINAVESYKLDANGTIATTFTFNKGGLDGPEKRFYPRGFVREGTGNAI